MFGYEKTELVRVMEQIYELNEERKRLEFELASLEFHKDYIPKRKKAMEQEIFAALVIIIPLTVLLISTLGYIIYFFFEEWDTIDGLSLLVSVLFIAFGGFSDYKLIKRELPSIVRLYASLDNDKAIAFAKKHDINTIQSDAIRTKKQYELLNEQRKVCLTRLEEVTRYKKELLQQQKEKATQKREIKEQSKTSSSGFSLKEEDIYTADISQLYEYYEKEESYVLQYISELEGKLQRAEKDIVAIEEEFEETKKKLIFFGVGFLFLIIFTAALQGVLGAFICVICFLATLFGMFYLENQCKQPIINYLVEHDNHLIKEYAFCNNLEPVGNLRKELLEQLEASKKELLSIRKQKDELEVFDLSEL